MLTRLRPRPRRKTAPAWHTVFVAMVPAIVNHARISFRHLQPEARAEAIQNAVCSACAAVARLAELGKLDLYLTTRQDENARIGVRCAVW